MARVTVEDCVQVVPNRYELVLLASQRARNIGAGAALTVDRDNVKNSVVSLREIAEQTISLDELRKHIAKGVNRMTDLTIEDDTLLALAGQGAMALEASPFGPAEMEEVSFEEAAEAETAAEDAEEAEQQDDEDGFAGAEEMTDEDVMDSIGEDSMEEGDEKALSA